MNSYRCGFSRHTGEELLTEFWREHGAEVRRAFGVEYCEHSVHENGGHDGHEPRYYTTVSNRYLAPDEFHADSCPHPDHHETWRDNCKSSTFLLQQQQQQEQEQQQQQQQQEQVEEKGNRDALCKSQLTVLAYPHHKWEAGAWAGDTEFCAQRCGSGELERTGELELDNAAVSRADASCVAALRVPPTPQTTVIFDGVILHRAVPPSIRAGLAQQTELGHKAGLRFSTVMQLVCYSRSNARHLAAPMQ